MFCADDRSVVRVVACDIFCTVIVTCRLDHAPLGLPSHPKPGCVQFRKASASSLPRRSIALSVRPTPPTAAAQAFEHQKKGMDMELLDVDIFVNSSNRKLFAVRLLMAAIIRNLRDP
jgi:hypothetical protein